jgi:hypothetical protein
VRRLDLVAFLFISAVSASAQVFDLQAEHVPLTELHDQ